MGTSASLFEYSYHFLSETVSLGGEANAHRGWGTRKLPSRELETSRNASGPSLFVVHRRFVSRLASTWSFGW